MPSNHSSFISALLTLAVSIAVLAVEPSLALRPTAVADGAGVMLDQVVATDRILPAYRLTNAPSVGQALTLTRAQIIAAAKAVMPELATADWAGPELTRVTRRTRQLEEAELLALLTAQLQLEYAQGRGELELRLARPWTSVNIADEPFNLRVIDMPANGINPTMLLRLELKSSRETLGNWQVFLQAKLWREVWVAHSQLVRGQLVRDADLAHEKRDVLPLRQPLATVAADDSTVEIAENIPAGFPLYARALRPHPVVHPGKTADALVQDGGMSISVKVEVLEDGAPGQSVRVRNVKTKREFRGKVQNEQTILVSI